MPGQTTFYDPMVGALPSTTQMGLSPLDQTLRPVTIPPAAMSASANDPIQQMIDEINSVYGSGTTPQGFNQFQGGIDLNNYINKAYSSNLENIPKIYGSQLTSGLQNINDIFGKQRADTAQEQSILGNLDSAAGQQQIGKVDQNKDRAISDLINQMSGQEAGAVTGAQTNFTNQLVGNQSNLANTGLAGAQFGQSQKNDLLNALLNSQQFGQTLGLNKDKLAEMMRQYNDTASRTDQQSRDALTLGIMQRDASQPSTFDQIMQGITAVGGLAQGAGSAAGGVSKLIPFL